MIYEKIKEQLKFCLLKEKKISFLVGAGISVESGIPTFRKEDGSSISASKKYTAKELSTLEMFNLNSKEVWKWFLYRKSLINKAVPNKSHSLLKDIEDTLGDQFTLISQNVDSLHKKAGNSNEQTFLIHGDFDYIRCGNECSNELYPFPIEINLIDRDQNVITEAECKALKCPKCRKTMRPHVLWSDEYYNEKYYHRDSVLKISKDTGILFVLGISEGTTLSQKFAQNILEKSGMIVDINLADGFFKGFLQNKTNGLIIKQESTAFLLELYAEIRNLIRDNHKSFRDKS